MARMSARSSPPYGALPPCPRRPAAPRSGAFWRLMTHRSQPSARDPDTPATSSGSSVQSRCSEVHEPIVVGLRHGAEPDALSVQGVAGEGAPVDQQDDAARRVTRHVDDLHASCRRSVQAVPSSMATTVAPGTSIRQGIFRAIMVKLAARAILASARCRWTSMSYLSLKYSAVPTWSKWPWVQKMARGVSSARSRAVLDGLPVQARVDEDALTRRRRPADVGVGRHPAVDHADDRGQVVGSSMDAAQEDRLGRDVPAPR